MSLLFTECTDGTYGYNCNNTCGNCIYGAACDKFTGSCLTGCSAGYYGDLCTDGMVLYYMYLCVLWVSTFPFSSILIFDFGIVPTVWYLFSSSCYHNNLYTYVNTRKCF
jgi:hypothetical protein